MRHLFIITVLSLCVTVAQADTQQTFTEWLQELKADAVREGISKKTVDATFKHAKLLPRVIQLDRSQPEFISTFLDYLNRRVNTSLVERGRYLLTQHQPLLAEVESSYGVPKQVLVAFWGMETHYGKMQGDFDLASALMTLAYEGRRAVFFRNELFNLMRIADARHASTSARIQGSWAGAMGHMQFMPSTLIAHGVDANHDGRVDIWQSLPDAMYSAANYLAKAGWRGDEPIMAQVDLPADFDYRLAKLNCRQHVDAWKALGVYVPAHIRNLENAAILLPQGWRGPALMVFSNFDVVMDWNRSVNYALAVAYLSEQLVGVADIAVEDDVELGALSFNEMWALQGKLNELGFPSGPPDGFPGLKTQEAIRMYQTAHGLPQDGYASPSLYVRLIESLK
ncbi:lytic murein transglycosylase [Methylophilaceae bacterium 11]|nr:lytic murein transglycosylase [Methylophilaceae bacterium 11]